MNYWIAAVLTVLVPTLGPAVVHAKTQVSLEAGPAWQSRNDQRIPSQGGSDFSLSDFDSGPFLAYRLYLAHRFGERHELRALYAPLALKIDGSFDRSIAFLDANFAANLPTQALYKFNSYRMTYAYHLDPIEKWTYAVGFTAKIRDAEVRLTQGALSQSKRNVGFVPLLHVRVARALTDTFSLEMDLDGLAAPQGRAFDLALFARYRPTSGRWGGYFGYRTVEGGADNREVFNFAWLHYLILGATVEF